MTSMSPGRLPAPAPLPGPAAGSTLAADLRRTAAASGPDLPALEEKWEGRVEFHDAGGRQVTVFALHEEPGPAH